MRKYDVVLVPLFLKTCVLFTTILCGYADTYGISGSGPSGSHSYSGYLNQTSWRYPRKAAKKLKNYGRPQRIRNGLKNSRSNQTSEYGGGSSYTFVRRGAARFEGFYFGLGMDLNHRNFKIEASDNLISEVSGSTWCYSKDLYNTRFLDSKLTRIGISPIIGYSFVVKEIAVLGFEAFADFFIGNNKESKKFMRTLKGNLPSDGGTFTIFNTKIETSKFTPGVAIRVGRYFQGIGSCMYGKFGAFFPNDSISVEFEGEPTLPDNPLKYKWNKVGYSFGIGFEKMLSCRPFQKNMSIRVEIGREVQPTLDKQYDKSPEDRLNIDKNLKIKTKFTTSGARYSFKLYGLIRP